MIRPRILIHRAKWVIATPWDILENGFVKVEGNVITEVGSGRLPEGDVIDWGPGALLAPLVNPHTHLELSALEGKVPTRHGFKPWVAALLEARAALSQKDLLEGAARGIASLTQSGCGVAGDISTLGITKGLLRESPLAGIWFHEHLGSTLPEDLSLERAPLSFSLAAHAPHSTAPQLLRHLKEKTGAAGLPLSIHVAESVEELEFIRTGRGEWADFLRTRGIDFSDWPIHSKSPVDYLLKLGILDEKTLAVHLLHATREDLQALKDRRVKLCLCPRSNEALHQALPDLEGMLALGLTPALGTDSLACVSSLSLWDEMAFTASRFPNVPLSEILAMGTIYGAEVLGMGKTCGRLDIGCLAPPVYRSLEAETKSQVLERLILPDKSPGRENLKVEDLTP